MLEAALKGIKNRFSAIPTVSDYMFAGVGRAEFHARRLGWPDWLPVSDGVISWKSDVLSASISINHGVVSGSIEMEYLGKTVKMVQVSANAADVTKSYVVGCGDVSYGAASFRFRDYVDQMGEPEVVDIDPVYEVPEVISGALI